jgi:hypothetical protein
VLASGARRLGSICRCRFFKKTTPIYYIIGVDF